MLFPLEILDAAEKTVRLFAQNHKKIAAAESCTGGLIAGALTCVPGASDVFERGFVTYSNDAKTDLLGVLPDTLAHFGAVSDEVAEEMASGALAYSLADVAVSVTGIAGPGGATAHKPVGLVCFGLAQRDAGRFHYRCQFPGDRDRVRLQAVAEALKLLQAALKD